MSTVMTNNNDNTPVTASTKRLPAEWEQQRCVVMAWPHCNTDWEYMLYDVQQCYTNIIASLLENGIQVMLIAPDKSEVLDQLSLIYDNVRHAGLLRVFEFETNDTWARDFGPITTIDSNGVLLFNDFKFNGWGLKFAADKDNLITRSLYKTTLGQYGRYINCLGFVLEGGSIESDGNGTILTTTECLLSPNRNGDLNRDEITARIKDFFGADRVLWLEHGALMGDDTDSHIDTLARFADEDTIVFCGAGPKTDPQHEGLAAMARQLKTLKREDGWGYNLVELPLPDPIYDESGQRLPATYANFLVTNNLVLMPSYNQTKNDILARKILESVFCDRKVVPIDCTALIKQHGSLHCITMQIPYSSNMISVE